MPELLQLGELAPSFELTNIQGRVVRLADYWGHPVLIAFLRGFL